MPVPLGQHDVANVPGLLDDLLHVIDQAPEKSSAFAPSVADSSSIAPGPRPLLEFPLHRLFLIMDHERRDDAHRQRRHRPRHERQLAQQPPPGLRRGRLLHATKAERPKPSCPEQGRSAAPNLARRRR